MIGKFARGSFMGLSFKNPEAGVLNLQGFSKYGLKVMVEERQDMKVFEHSEGFDFVVYFFKFF